MVGARSGAQGCFLRQRSRKVKATSMKICYFDAWSGIRGDMTVGALVDAGAPAEAIREGLDSLNTGATFDFERTTRREIAATEWN